MKKSAYLLLVLVACACNPQLVPYTSQVQREIGLNLEDLKKVQFYNSNQILLYREIGQNSTTVVSGEIKVIDGKSYEQVVIPANTPGILVQENDGKRLGISFEEGPDRYIVFGLDPARSGVFSIYGRNWKNHIATVDYDGKEYHLARQSGDAILLVNYKKLNDLKINTRRAKGRLIN